MPANNLCCCIQAVQETFCGNTQGAEVAIIFDSSERHASGSSSSDAAAAAASQRPSANDAIDDDDDVFRLQRSYIVSDTDSLAGKVRVTLRKPGSKLEHLGLTAELVGDVALSSEKGQAQRFLHAETNLAEPGELFRSSTYEFAFDVKRPHESYYGTNVQLRYYVIAKLLRRVGDVIVQQEVVVHVPSSLPEVTRSVKTEVGIGDKLRLELECNKWKYHLRDVILGSVHFLLADADIDKVAVQIVRRETTNKADGEGLSNDQLVIAEHEIVDGCPETGVVVPIRMYLANYPLTPTMRSVEDRFNVKYYLNLVITDVDDNRYFKQQEIKLYRRSESEACSSDAATTNLRAKKNKAVHPRQQATVKVTFHNEAKPSDSGH